MCYSGSCEYEYYMGDGQTGCHKPAGEPCPHEVDAEQEHDEWYEDIDE